VRPVTLRDYAAGTVTEREPPPFAAVAYSTARRGHRGQPGLWLLHRTNARSPARGGHGRTSVLTGTPPYDGHSIPELHARPIPRMEQRDQLNGRDGGERVKVFSGNVDGRCRVNAYAVHQVRDVAAVHQCPSRTASAWATVEPDTT